MIKNSESSYKHSFLGRQLQTKEDFSKQVPLIVQRLDYFSSQISREVYHHAYLLCHKVSRFRHNISQQKTNLEEVDLQLISLIDIVSKFYNSKMMDIENLLRSRNIKISRKQQLTQIQSQIMATVSWNISSTTIYTETLVIAQEWNEFAVGHSHQIIDITFKKQNPSNQLHNLQLLIDSVSKKVYTVSGFFQQEVFSTKFFNKMGLAILYSVLQRLTCHNLNRKFGLKRQNRSQGFEKRLSKCSFDFIFEDFMLEKSLRYTLQDLRLEIKWIEERVFQKLSNQNSSRGEKQTFHLDSVIQNQKLLKNSRGSKAESTKQKKSKIIELSSTNAPSSKRKNSRKFRKMTSTNNSTILSLNSKGKKSVQVRNCFVSPFTIDQ